MEALVSDGKIEKPQAKPVEKAPSLARKIADFQGEPVEGRRGVAAIHAHKQQYMSGVEYRFSDGEHGAPPLANLAQQRGQPVREYVGREQSSRAMRKAEGASSSTSIPKTTGAPLPADVKSKMEPKLGADLSGVKIHTGGDSAKAATGFGARAFTVGSDVHFGAGQYAPGTKEGDRLLAHELTHVVQGQAAGVQRKAEADGEPPEGEEKKAEVSDPSEPAEKEADAKSDEVVADLHDEKDGSGERKASGKQQKGTAKEEKGDEKTDGKASNGDARAKSEENGDNGGKKPAEQKSAPISAKLDGVGLKVFRATPPTPTPPKQNQSQQGGNAEKKLVAFPTSIAGGKAQLVANGTKLELQEGGTGLVERIVAGAEKVTAARFPDASTKLRAAGNQVGAIQRELDPIKVEGGKIAETDLPKVTSGIATVGTALTDLLSACKISSLGEIGMKTKSPPTPWTATLRYRNNKLGNQDFLTEYDRQMKLHESHANQYSVDEWMANMETANLETKGHFEAAEESTKQAMVKELQSRIETSKGQLKAITAKFKKAEQLIVAMKAAVLASEQKPDDAALKKQAEDATAAFMNDPYVLKNFTSRIWTPRQEKTFKSQHLAGLTAVQQEEQAKWTAAGDDSEWGTILHLPDQVAGGRGFMPTYDKEIPKPPPEGQEAPQEWIDYKNWLKQYIGSARVNSAIGPSWTAAADELKKQATAFFSDATKAAYPMYKVSIKLNSEPNGDKR